VPAALAVVLTLLAASPATAGGREDRVSRFGEYRGYSSERYTTWERSSRYVAVRDGTRLAVDVFRPVDRHGDVARERLPVVWMPKRYVRATVRPDGSVSTVMESSPTAQLLIKHGYVIAAVDMRGTGASFGTRDEVSDPVDGRDGYDLTEWFARQPWSDGNVGMFGISYEGRMQLVTASTNPPRLKAIMPEVSPFDWYWIVHFGGIWRESMGGFETQLRTLDASPTTARVDADTDGSLLAAAQRDHRGNTYDALGQRTMPYRDSVNPSTGHRNWLERSGGVYTAGISRSGVAVYHRAGFFPGVGLDQAAWYVNQGNARSKMVLGPWAGGGLALDDEWTMWSTEQLRFYDYWLKDIDNGIMREAPIHYSLPSSHTRVGGPWQGASQWPPTNTESRGFYFQDGPSGSVASVNDGSLDQFRPRGSGADVYTVDYGVRHGNDDPARPGSTPIDNTEFDKRGLTYTTRPLGAAVEMAGQPDVTLWVSSTASDGDFVVKIHDVDPAGVSTTVTEGQLKASSRALGNPPYRFFGQPWPSHDSDEAKPLAAGRPNKLEFTFLRGVIGYRFQPGHRIRVTVTGADLNQGPASETLDPPPIVTIYRDARHPSSIRLPVVRS